MRTYAWYKCICMCIYIRRPQPSAGGARPRKSGFAPPLAAQQHVLWPHAGRFPGDFLLVSESNVRQQAGLKRLPAPSAALKPCPAPLAAQQHVLWPPAGRFPGDFLLVSESNVRHYRLAFCPAPLAAQQHVLWPPAGRFPGNFLLVSESNVRHYRLALKVSRRPRLPLNPARRPWRPSSMSFGHLPGAFLEIFFWFQKATLGTIGWP